jgi:hypothetical protein
MFKTSDGGWWEGGGGEDKRAEKQTRSIEIIYLNLLPEDI